jgi:uncharacterized protein (TIRG00374 family)
MIRNLIIGTIVSVFFFWLILKNIDITEAVASLEQANWLYAIPAVIILLFSFVLRAIRWQVLLVPVGRVGFASSFRATMVGFMANSVLPARMGEFIRAFVLTRREGIKVESVFATIVVERIFDGYMLLLFLLGGLFLAPLKGTGAQFLKTGIIASIILYNGVLIAMLFLHHKQEPTIRFFHKLLRWLPWCDRIIEALKRFSSGLGVLGSTRHVLIIAGWTLAVWVTAMAVLHPLLAGFDLGASLPWYAPYVITPVVALGVMLPAAPGYAGTYHAACVAGILMLAPESDPNAGRAFSFALHALNMVPIIAVGIVCLWLEGLSFGDIGKRRKTPESTG